MPQNRLRFYIVCIREDVDQGTFAWPEPLGVPPEIDRFLDDRAAQLDETDAFAPKGRAASKTFGAKMSKLTNAGKDPLREPYLFDVTRTDRFSGAMHDRCPCLLRNASIWISHHGRSLNLSEKCRLQGMNPRRLQLAVSENQFQKQLGNTMSVNVLERLLISVLPAAGLTRAGI